MKPAPFTYHGPRSRQETLALLDELGDEGKVLAGGQSLVPMLNMRLAAPAALVDLGGLDELDRVEVTADHVRVEARVPHERLRREPRLADALPVLRDALDLVAHPAIRHRGTSVGSIVHADPAAELPAVLALVGGHVELASRQGERTVAADDFVLGPLESDTRPDELALAAVFPVPPPRTGSAFVELARRHGDYALAGVGVTLGLDDDRRVERARAVVIGVGGTPVTVELTDHLAGQAHDALDAAAAVAALRDAIDPSDDVHATGAYRRHLAGVLLERAVVSAVGRATEEAT